MMFLTLLIFSHNYHATCGNGTFLRRKVKMSCKLQKKTALQNENEIFDKIVRLILLSLVTA